MIRIEYVWIDGYGNTRSKMRCFYYNHDIGLDDIPVWNYDGSSTGQATTKNSEILLYPVRLYISPFNNSEYLVLCECYKLNNPHKTNNRNSFIKLIETNPHGTRYGFEQEFFLTQMNGMPLDINYTKKQKYNYCGVGSHMIGRECVETAMNNCINAGLNITGMNSEVAPGQWELQIDDMGISACDGLWMLRYILAKTAEQFNFGVSFHPKPLLLQNPRYNGSGCHANFSTTLMRNKNGYKYILKTIEKLNESHNRDILLYGKDNYMRLTGECETSSMDKFTYGVGDRTASIRIPSVTAANKCGYFEDRRPSSNMDPYVIGEILYKAYLNNI